MMQAAITPALKKEFAFAAAMREEDILYREKIARFEARQRAITENARIAGEKRDREFADLLHTVFASQRQIADFTAKLDRYDEKTVEALMENGAALEAVQKRLDDLLGKAHVLPDGRRVFKTEDGTRVFDETGLELGSDVIDPKAISDSRPYWERYKPDFHGKGDLLREQDDLHAFQAKSDAVREELGRGNVTVERLDELDADLKGTMPEAVRRKLGNEGPTRDAEAAPQGPVNGAHAATMNPVEQRPAGFSPM